MPQLDKLTFISQLFWLILTFLIFYFIFLKFLLPKISIILKFRLKQLDYYNNQINRLNSEENKSIHLYENFLYDYLLNIKQLITTSINVNNEWLTKQFLKVNNNLLYVKYLLNDINFKSNKNVNKFSLFNCLLLNQIYNISKLNYFINKLFNNKINVFNNLSIKKYSNDYKNFINPLLIDSNKLSKLKEHNLLSSINSNFYNYISSIKKINIYYNLKFNTTSNKYILNLYKINQSN